MGKVAFTSHDQPFGHIATAGFAHAQPKMGMLIDNANVVDAHIAFGQAVQTKEIAAFVTGNRQGIGAAICRFFQVEHA